MIAVTSACQGCGACLLTCPERAIRPAGHGARGAGPLAVLVSRCTGCGECVEVCPVDAIEFTDGSMIMVDRALIQRKIQHDHGIGRTGASALVSRVAGEVKGERETA